MCVQAFYRFVCRPCGEDEFRVGVEAEAVHLWNTKIEFLNFFELLSVVAPFLINKTNTS